MMKKIPSAETKSTRQISNYIQSKFKSDKDKIRAVYFFTANYLSYDFENRFNINLNLTPKDRVEKALQTRKGVCSNYAELFNELANNLGIESYVIDGITKQNGVNDALSHSWNAAKINSNWYLFDATWGSGYVSENQYLKKIDDNYFMVKPDSMILTHLPFDYLWQFSNYPLGSEQFINSKSRTKRNKIAYDSILIAYQKAPDLDKLNQSILRIESNGLNNDLILKHYQILKEELVIKGYNETVDLYNKAIYLNNLYAKYKNSQFNPRKSDSEIIAMLNNPKKMIIQAKNRMSAIKYASTTNKENVELLKKKLNELETKLDTEMEFIRLYLKEN